MSTYFTVLAWLMFIIAGLMRIFAGSLGYSAPTYTMAMACFFMLVSIRERQRQPNV